MVFSILSPQIKLKLPFQGKIHSIHSFCKLQKTQSGLSLIELMIGITIGIMVVLVAIGALTTTRSISSNVRDISSVEQEASYIMKIIGQQIRQANAPPLDLELSNATTDPDDTILKPVYFLEKSNINQDVFDLTDIKSLLGGTRNSFKVSTTGFREPTTTSQTDAVLRNCLGISSNSGSATPSIYKLTSIFKFQSPNSLLCQTEKGTSQPLSSHVAEFKVLFLLKNNDRSAGYPSIRYVEPSLLNDADWRKVQAIQVCMTVFGDDLVNVPPGKGYYDCDGNEVAIDSLTGSRKNKMHLVFKNVFQLRSQGLT